MKKLLLTFIYSLPVLFANAQNPSFDWAIGDNLSWFDEGRCIDVDASGNVYVSGNLYGTTDFDPSANTYTLTSAGNNDIFIAKYDALGNFIWAKRIGNSGIDYSYSMNVDSLGNVYTTGVFSGTVDFDPGIGTYTIAANSSRTIFVSKLNSNGNFIWAKQICSTLIPALTLDDFGNVLITGICNDTTDLDPSIGVFKLGTNGSLGGQFVLKLDVNGNFIWAKRLLLTSSSPATSFLYSIKSDKFGNIYTTGFFQGVADFDPSTSSYSLTSSGSANIFISKLDSSGNFIWAKQIGGIGQDVGKAITIDKSENVYITGDFSGMVDFDPNTAIYNLTSSGQDDLFVLKLNTTGNFLWAKKIGGTDVEDVQSIVLDDKNNIYIAGWFKSTVDFDPSTAVYNLSSAGDYDAFISKLDNNGNFMWAKQMGGTKYDDARSIFVDASNNVYTAGNYAGIVDFDPNSGVFNLSSDTINGGFYIQKLNQTSVGIMENEALNIILIYPNPSSTTLNIKLSELNKDKVSFQLLNSLGELLIDSVLINTYSKVNIQNLSSGIYFVKIIQKDKQQIFKIIKE